MMHRIYLVAERCTVLGCLCDRMPCSSAGGVGVPDPRDEEQRYETLAVMCLMTAVMMKTASFA